MNEQELMEQAQNKSAPRRSKKRQSQSNLNESVNQQDLKRVKQNAVTRAYNLATLEDTLVEQLLPQMRAKVAEEKGEIQDFFILDLDSVTLDDFLPELKSLTGGSTKLLPGGE